MELRKIMTTFCERREVSKELPGATVLDEGKVPVVGEDGKYKLEGIFPDIPDDDGSYFLGLTVADGVPVMTWEAISE